MADVQDVPVSRADDVGVKRDKDDLLDHLDELLERYLHTLHEYQQQMQQLSKQLSNVNYPRYALIKVALMNKPGLYVTCSSQLPQFIFRHSIRAGLLR